ncbi:MAG: asparagine synthase (glutamine-hydrolyzing) [Polyangiaceae bacterium]
MCGIAGIVGMAGGRALVREMCERIRHRGPDGGGVVEHAEATLGMTRLSIVDVEHGHQPMLSDDGDITLVYNGEIYNAPQLRAQLVAEGVSFKTRSDTEVVLRLYERDPDRVEEHLVGMWAFCVHDRRRRRLVLSRDRFGIKPLFVAEHGRSLAFASELTCFDRRSPELAPAFTIDRGAAHAMIAWSYVPEDATIYQGVRRVPPAHRIERDLATGATTTRRYWSLCPSADAARVRSLDEACDMVEAALKRALVEHLESDVPIASFLSGGIDSSLVTAYAVASGRMPIKAFTIGFREPRFDESPYARATAAALGIPIEVGTLDEDAARADLADALLAYDEPFGDSSSLATHLLSRHVSREYKVALAGDGGDEAFAGYTKYRILRARRLLGRVPLAKSVATAALRHLPTKTDRSSKLADIMRVASKVGRGLKPDDADAYVALTQFGLLDRTRVLVRGASDAERFEEAARARFHRAVGTELQRWSAADLHGPLPNDMLTKVDRASMSCSLEVRVPFLDHRVVELGVGLPSRFTLGTQGKAVLRELHQRRFGRELAQRKKMGFGVPVERWLSTSLQGACERLFARERLDRFGLLEPRELSGGAHAKWVRRDPMLLWHTFALAAWCEAQLGDGPEALRELLSVRRPRTDLAAQPSAPA